MAKPLYETAIEPYLENIREWYLAGETKKQIADRLHIGYATLRENIGKHPALAALFARALPNLDEEIRNAMYRRAQGYDYIETVTETLFDKDGNVLNKREKAFAKHLPPDPTSAKFWWEINHKGEAIGEEPGVIILPEVADG